MRCLMIILAAAIVIFTLVPVVAAEAAPNIDDKEIDKTTQDRTALAEPVKLGNASLLGNGIDCHPQGNASITDASTKENLDDSGATEFCETAKTVKRKIDRIMQQFEESRMLSKNVLPRLKTREKQLRALEVGLLERINSLPDEAQKLMELIMQDNSTERRNKALSGMKELINKRLVLLNSELSDVRSNLRDVRYEIEKVSPCKSTETESPQPADNAKEGEGNNEKKDMPEETRSFSEILEKESAKAEAKLREVFNIKDKNSGNSEKAGKE